MCRGNPLQWRSLPGGTATETFTTGAAVKLTGAQVQIDPDAAVTATASLSVDGSTVATDVEQAAGDTTFHFNGASAPAGSTIALTVTFTATAGKIITIYTVEGGTRGNLEVTNSCPDGAPTFSASEAGLRAKIWGVSSP